MNDNLFIFHIGNGENFEKSKHLNTWGIREKFINSIKKFNSNTVLIFVKKGNIIIGFAKFIKYYNSNDEPLISINTETRDNLNLMNINIK